MRPIGFSTQQSSFNRLLTTTNTLSLSIRLELWNGERSDSGKVNKFMPIISSSVAADLFYMSCGIAAYWRYK